MNVVIDEVLKRVEHRPGEAVRLFHGRGHMFPGFEHLVVSWYPPYIHIAAYARAAGLDIEALRAAITAAGHDVEGVAVQTRDGRRTSTEVVWGDVPDEHCVEEAGAKYWIRPKLNQNVGLFMDMSHVRQRLSTEVSDARVLNLFAYTCAFSVAAIQHGARSVVNNDMSKNALDWGRRNHALNGHDQRVVRMLPHNVFKSWWKIRQLGPYDTLIIDPPTNQRGSFVAERQYGQILKRIPELAAPGARVVACLNSPFLDSEFLTAQMARWCPACSFEERLPPHPDFPDKFPERALKVMLYRYRG